MILKLFTIILTAFSFCILSLPADAGTIKGKISIRTALPVQRAPRSGSLYAGGGAAKKDDASTKHNTQLVILVHIDGYKEPNLRPPKTMPVLDQRNLSFVPHILPIVVGTTVRFPNSDDVYHNSFSYSKTKSFDLGRYAKGKSKTVTFDKPGIVKVFCEIHSNMNAIIVVLENSYFDIADENGEYDIENVPPGSYTLKIWHELLSTVTTKAITLKQNETITVDFEI